VTEPEKARISLTRSPARENPHQQPPATTLRASTITLDLYQHAKNHPDTWRRRCLSKKKKEKKEKRARR